LAAAPSQAKPKRKNPSILNKKIQINKYKNQIQKNYKNKHFKMNKYKHQQNIKFVDFAAYFKHC